MPGILLEALPYIHKFKKRIFVVKYGGAAMTEEPLKQSFAREIVLLRMVGIKVLIVHGGGEHINEAMRQRGMEPRKVGGRRQTDLPTMTVVREVLGGRINQDIVQLLQAHSGKAIGINGLSMDLFRTAPCQHAAELGYVGDVESVNAGNLRYLLKKFIPVIAPLGIGPDGAYHNINADDAASSISVALQAEKLIYMSDVDGILDREGKTIQTVSKKTAAAMMQTGEIHSGMVPKIHSGLRAMQGGVDVHMINGKRPHSLLLEIFTDEGIGTKLTR